MGGNVIEVNDDSFEATIINATQPALVDFWAVWCGPCKMIAPHVEAIATDLAGKAVVAKVDVDKSRGTAIKFGIQSIPTLLFFKGGKVVDRLVGGQYKKDDIKKKLEGLL
jgi:thioredoxin 1